jgi:hypothetical protein
MNQKLKISLYLAAIFIAGVITGIFISYQVARHMMPDRNRMADRWCGELESKLGLTPDQTAKIRPIIDDRISGFRNNLSHEMESSLSNCYVQIAIELDPGQRKKLEQIQQEQLQFIRARIGGSVTNGQ